MKNPIIEELFKYQFIQDKVVKKTNKVKFNYMVPNLTT